MSTSKVVGVFHYVKVDIKSSGVTAIRSLPQSKLRMAYHYPPPGTLVGALAYPLIHLKKERKEIIYEGKKFKSAAEKVLPFVKWATLSVSGRPKVYGTLLKVNRLYRGEVGSGVTAFPFSLSYGEKEYRLTGVYLIDGESLKRHGYTLKEVLRAAWGITRIGSRESIVSVESVESGSAKFEQANEAETRFALPLENKSIEGRGLLQSVVDWTQGLTNYSRAERILFFYPEEMVRVEGDLSIVRIDDEVIVL